MTDAVAYFWSAKVPLDDAWRDEVERFVGAVAGVVLAVEARDDVSIKLLDGIHDPVEFRFARQRGGGTVSLAAGARVILASLGVAARLKLELSDSNGQALNLSDPRSLLARIAFAENALQIETIAEEVGLCPKRVHLHALAGSSHRTTARHLLLVEIFRLVTGGFSVGPEGFDPRVQRKAHTVSTRSFKSARVAGKPARSNARSQPQESKAEWAVALGAIQSSIPFKESPCCTWTCLILKRSRNLRTTSPRAAW